MTDPAPYDALLVVSFGGPEKPDDVMPFLENVTRGRDVPPERLKAVAEHYHRLGGRSPINDQCRELIVALEVELRAHGIELPVYWGNRNWHPLLPDTVRQMQRDGVKRALAYVTSAFGSYSGCRQYADNIAAARDVVGAGAPLIEPLRRCFNHPSFVSLWAGSVRAALAEIAPGNREAARVVFTAHSIPIAMARVCPYERELAAACKWVMERVEPIDFDLVYQSRSGPPQVPWLEPDVLDHLTALSASGVEDVVVAPIGFLSDHVEVVWDLDHEAAESARELGLRMVRARTPGAHPAFVGMVRELVQERLDGKQERRACGDTGPAPDRCPVDCCNYALRVAGATSS